MALYTFFETITNTYTGNVSEKTLICHLVEKLATDSCKVRMSEVSIIGNEDEIFAFDARSLDIDRCNWNAIDVQFVLIKLNNVEKIKLSRRRSDERNRIRREEIMTMMNTMSRWRTHPIGVSMMEFLFPRETTETTNDVIDENKRIVEMTNAIRNEQWEELGKLLRENHRSTCKHLNFLPDDIKRITNIFETIEGVLGASVFDYGTSIVTLVQKSKLKTFISFLTRTKIPQQEYYLMRACTGAYIINMYERPLYPWNIKYSLHPKLIIKYHLSEKSNIEKYNHRKYVIPELVDTISLLICRSPKL